MTSTCFVPSGRRNENSRRRPSRNGRSQRLGGRPRTARRRPASPRRRARTLAPARFRPAVRSGPAAQPDCEVRPNRLRGRPHSSNGVRRRRCRSGMRAPIRAPSSRGRTRRQAAAVPARPERLGRSGRRRRADRRESNLRTRRCVNARPKSEKWMWRRPPRVRVVAPRVRPGFTVTKRYAPSSLQRASCPGEVRVERSGCGRPRAGSDPPGGLPDLDQRAAGWPPSSSMTRPWTIIRSPSGSPRRGPSDRRRLLGRRPRQTQCAQIVHFSAAAAAARGARASAFER